MSEEHSIGYSIIPVSPENMNISNIIVTHQFIFKNMCVCTHVHVNVITIDGKSHEFESESETIYGRAQREQREG